MKKFEVNFFLFFKNDFFLKVKNLKTTKPNTYFYTLSFTNDCFPREQLGIPVYLSFVGSLLPFSLPF